MSNDQANAIAQSSECFVDRDGFRLCYDTFGNPEDPAYLLVMGLATQMTGWDSNFCKLLASRGFFVIRFDNRDIGRSSKLDEMGIPNLLRLFVRKMAGSFGGTPYSLSDMAADAVSVLDHLQIQRAHVAAVSMGAMVAQTLAIEYPRRVSSLVSMHSTTGSRRLPLPDRRIIKLFLGKAPSSKEESARRLVELYGIMGSPKFYDATRITEMSNAAYDRDGHRLGAARQLAAVISARPRTHALSLLKIPVTVLHGKQDRMMHFKHGMATAEAIPNARFELWEDLGHDLPVPLWNKIVDVFEETARRPTKAKS